MARTPSVARRHQQSSHVRFATYPLLPTYNHRRGIQESDGKPKRPSNVMKKKDWEDATCSVCLEFPHNAVLLLCSSYDKGCRPYMCGTSHRFSNCLDLFMKAYINVGKENAGSSTSSIRPKSDISELACPLCRGEVKGWTVVESARKYLNAKTRSCMQENCSFTGTFKELRKHVKADHPSAKPRQVDPVLKQNWRRLEHERERGDVLSTLRSSMPGSVVMGDYVIENDNDDFDYDSSDDHRYSPPPIDSFERSRGSGRMSMDDNWFNFRVLLQAFVNTGNPEFASRLMRSQSGNRVFNSSLNAAELGGQSQTEEGGGAHNSEDGSGVGNLGRAARARQGSVGGTERTSRRRRLRRMMHRSIGLI